MTRDFNIRDSDWDPCFHYHLVHSGNLLTIADSLGLELSPPTNSGPTKYADNPYNTNSVLDLVFLAPNNQGFGKHILLPKIQKCSNYVLLIINVGIKDEDIDIVVQSIKKNSNEKRDFIDAIKFNIKCLDKSLIMNKEIL